MYTIYRLLLLTSILYIQLNLSAGTHRNTILLTSTEISVEEYIDLYKGIAMSEMKRSGIPASITLAQGILESRFGNSYLAVDGNNHFGIKCHATWTGKRLYADDDEEQECFRKYDDVYESYVDHTNFLANRDRYAFLFTLDPKDYSAWATGLQRAGYATSQSYAEDLIALIERHDLQDYDWGGEKCSYTSIEVLDQEILPKVLYYNRIKTIIFTCEVTPQQIVQAYDKISLNRLLRYNDFNSAKSIPASTKIFLQPKRNKGPYGVNKHIVQTNESMRDLSQLYGIKLHKLYKRNRMVFGTQPAVGETIYLRGRKKYPPRLRVGNQQPTPPQPIAVEKEKTVVPKYDGEQKKEEKETVTPPIPSPAPEKIIVPTPKPEKEKEKEVVPNDGDKEKVQTEKEKEKVTTYVVQKGDTLYGVARKFNISIPTLKKLNKLTSNTIKVGQTLITKAK